MWSSIPPPIRRAASALPLGAALLASVACASRTTEIESPGAVVTTPQPMPAVRTAQSVTATWPMKPREAASTVIAKYGQPDVVGDRVLI